MKRSTHRLDAPNHRLRRVGRLARRRLRIEGADLSNGIHTDGRLSVVISGFETDGDGRREMFQWWSDRPVALVIVRSGIDGDDMSFSTGPIRWGTGVREPGDGGLKSITFCYDIEPAVRPRQAPTDGAGVTKIPARLLRSLSPA
jgi:hypothetical protein